MSRAKKDIPATDGHPERLIAGANYWSTYELSAGDCEKTEHSIEERKSECCERVEGAVGEIGAEGATVSPLVLSDGTYGLRKQVASFDCLGLSESVPATCFPPACLSACTFDPALLRLMGQALGEECLQESVDVLLGPAINIKRHPLGGRNFEYYSEDPLLSGKMAAAMTDGVQSEYGCGTTIKHFACNNQEDNRMGSNSVLSERTLRQIYLKGFEIAVKESQPMSIMTSYNLVNGIHAANNYDLCTKAARDEWGFKGVFMTDWTTTHNGPDCTASGCMRAGNDLVMPGIPGDHDNIRAALADGSLPLEQLKLRIAHLVDIVWKSNRYEIS